MSKTFKPTKNKIVIERHIEESELAKSAKTSGIIIPDELKTTKISNRATVVYVGFGEDIEGLGIKPGDIVLLSRYSGIPIEVNGKDLLIISMSDVLGFEIETGESPKE